MTRGLTLEFDHLHNIVNIVDDALVAIRILDREVYEKSDSTTYLQLRASHPTGGVVRALVAPRNNAAHHMEIIEPDLHRAVGPVDDRYIIFPRWKLRSELPSEMFQYPDGKKRGQPRVAYISSYDNHAAGRLVLDTLLDAFAFFDRCDPSIADRDSDGRLVGFPLTPLPVAEYHRLSPEWPDHEVVHAKIRATAAAEAPAGMHREILGWIRTDTGPVFCGYTVTSGRRTAFTEQMDQMMRDVASGYRYEAVLEGATVEVQLRGGVLFMNPRLLTDHPREVKGSSAEPWTGWWELCVRDAYYYCQQRQAP